MSNFEKTKEVCRLLIEECDIDLLSRAVLQRYGVQTLLNIETPFILLNTHVTATWLADVDNINSIRRMLTRWIKSEDFKLHPNP